MCFCLALRRDHSVWIDCPGPWEECGIMFKGGGGRRMLNGEKRSFLVITLQSGNPSYLDYVHKNNLQESRCPCKYLDNTASSLSHKMHIPHWCHSEQEFLHLLELLQTLGSIEDPSVAYFTFLL